MKEGAGPSLALAGLLLVGGAVGLAIETTTVLQSKDVPRRAFPNGWLPGAPRLDRLEQFLEQARAKLPDDAVVAVDSNVFQDNDLHYLRMWCAYFLPRQRVVRKRQLPDADRPAYLVSYPGLFGEPAGTTELQRDADTSLHRLD